MFGALLVPNLASRLGRQRRGLVDRCGTYLMMSDNQRDQLHELLALRSGQWFQNARLGAYDRRRDALNKDRPLFGQIEQAHATIFC